MPGRPLSITTTSLIQTQSPGPHRSHGRVEISPFLALSQRLAKKHRAICRYFHDLHECGVRQSQSCHATHQPWPLPPPLTLLNSLTSIQEFAPHLSGFQVLRIGSSLVPLDFKGNFPNCTQTHVDTRERARTRSTRSHLSWCTHGPVQRRPFLCFAEIGVLGVATPQLLAGVKRTELKDKEKSEWTTL